jgi:hypothetical protein
MVLIGEWGDVAVDDTIVASAGFIRHDIGEIVEREVKDTGRVIGKAGPAGARHAQDHDQKGQTA